ncbi:kinase-like domain-containing protein [Aspergillus carlsbadensis]|nr:kinase-like domain-containing protein [Aspergillus carlsbadensis]
MGATKPSRRRHGRGPPLPLNLRREDFKIYSTWEEEHFEQCDFMYMVPTGEIFIGHSHRQSDTLRVSTMKAALRRGPDDEVYPRVPENTTTTTTTTSSSTNGTPPQPLTLAPAEILADPSRIFEKQPGIGWCCVSPEAFAERIFHEARIMQTIATQPHPHIIRYHGCRAERGLVRSLVFERLDQDLRAYCTPRTLDSLGWTRRLESAVQHLHSLGIAHNDLSLGNIMIREKQNGEVEPVLIDFGFPARQQARSYGSHWGHGGGLRRGLIRRRRSTIYTRWGR